MPFPSLSAPPLCLISLYLVQAFSIPFYSISLKITLTLCLPFSIRFSLFLIFLCLFCIWILKIKINIALTMAPLHEYIHILFFTSPN